ncbi:MAG TPA: hypothetical protein VHX14_12350 [Thermoanaerobaculia bacterium]|nr:hypothetical protein [Thermoanaerobaculia bacterium]
MTASVFELQRSARPRPRTRNRVSLRPQFEVHAISVPSRMFTGDFWFIHRAADCLWFALGDVAGKGLPAALVRQLHQADRLRQYQHASSPSASSVVA